MSQENVDRLRLGYEHVSQTGELLAEICHPDFVWDTTTFAPGGLNLERCIGVDEANSWIARWTEAFEDWSIDIEEILDAGDKIVVFARQRATTKQGGPEIEMRLAQVWTLRDGLLAQMEMYAARDQALEAAGLSE